MQPVDCLTDVEPTVCAETSQPTLHKRDLHLALMYVDVVLTLDASQKYANEESIDNRYMNEATSEWPAVY